MSQGNSAPPQKVEEMFDRISGVYDGMNLAISGFQEPRWRRRIVAASAVGPGDAALTDRELQRRVEYLGDIEAVLAAPGQVAHEAEGPLTGG